jgi:type III pantothenate kinase
MMLLLDIGNSRVKWAIADGDALRGGGSFPHDGSPADAIGNAHLPRAQQAWVCNVTGALHEEQIAATLRDTYALEPRFARTAPSLDGLRSGYAEPQRLGVDRWLCMLALWTERRDAFCVASAGTALTFDAVDASGQHLGGVIAPGLSTMQSATLGSTRFAVAGTSMQYDDALGRDTEACVRQGALHAGAGLLDRLGARHAGAHVITGGDAEMLEPLLAARWELRPQLVLEGLLALARR